MAVNLPLEIQNDNVLFAKNEELRMLRANLITINSQIESGTYSGKSIIENIYSQLLDTINFLLKQIEVIVVPEENRTDFTNGIVTLDDFGSFDILKYYNELQRLKWIYYSLAVMIQQMNETNTVSNNPALAQSDNILNQLNDNEFLVQGAENPVYDQEVTYKYDTIVQGDTLPTIAARNYDGDISQWPKISSANNITDSDLLDSDLVGVIIRIPVITQLNSQSIDDNLVYETKVTTITQASIDQYLYGRDILLVNKKMQISSSNDIKRVKGTACVVQNIQSRFLNSKGSLNPLTPDWGLDSLDRDSNIPPIISLDRLLTDMEYQAMADPRVVNASILRNTLKLNGDAFTVEMEIQLIGNRDSLIIPMRVPQVA